jgi:hypothetical protein
MKTNLFDPNKRKFFFTGALALASLKIFNLKDNALAKETSKSLEERLEAKIAEHDLQIERLKAVSAIQNCMGRYETFHLVGTEVGKTPTCYALWRDDVTVEVSDGGIVYGAKNVEAYWKNFTKMDPQNKSIFFHSLATPCIQVAGDGKTAKATWWSPGFETGSGGGMAGGPASDSGGTSGTGPGGAQGQGQGSGSGSPTGSGQGGGMAVWCWGKYACDFIKNPKTGEWKIWHQHWFRTTRNDYHLSFVEFARQEDAAAKAKSLATSGGSGNKPSMPGGLDVPVLPTVFHSPFSSVVGHHPFPIDPEPYETYNGDFRWIYGGDEREIQHGVNYRNRSLEKIYNVNYPNII